MVSFPATGARASGVTKPAPIATPPSLPRRPTLVRKRSDANLDGDGSSPASPTKKPKVAFNDEVDVKVLEQWGKSPVLVRDEVRRALERHARGDKWEYESLKEIYAVNSADAPNATVLRSYTAAIAGHASTLGRAHRDLVEAMLHSDWITRDNDYVALFQRFLGNLASTQGIWLSDVLGFLVDMFKKSPVQRDDDSAVPPSQIRQRVHSTLELLLRLIPSASSVLAGVLSNSYPNASDSRRRHVVFVRNMLRITHYAPELQAEILSLIASELVKIDVQVQINLLDLADEVSDGVVQELSQLNSLDDASDDDVESDSDDEPNNEEVDPDAERAREITAHIEKLDAILDILFAFYTRLMERPETASFVADTLLAQFNALILPSYRSRHTQFLLFHFAQQSPTTMDMFAGALTAVIFDASRPPLVRESAAAYLASFVARARHVPGETVRDVFEYFGAQLAYLRSTHGPTCRGPDPRRYRTFYALTQALLYIFCFRWRDLTVAAADNSSAHGATHALSPASTSPEEDPEDPDAPPVFLRAARATLRDNIFSALNPLRVCAPAIVAEFARVARRLRFMYVYTLLESNRRVRLPTGPAGPASTTAAGTTGMRDTALSARKDQDWQRLDAYFPFDPYRLPRSRRWLEGDYREWVGVPGESDDEGSASEEPEGDDGEAEESETESTATDDGEE